MKPELIIAMDNGKRLVNKTKCSPAVVEMYKDIYDEKNGPYIIIGTDGTDGGKDRATSALDWDGWEIKEEPQTRPSTRGELIYDVTGPEHTVVRLEGDSNDDWQPVGKWVYDNDSSIYEIGTVQRDGTVINVHKSVREV